MRWRECVQSSAVISIPEAVGAVADRAVPDTTVQSGQRRRPSAGEALGTLGNLAGAIRENASVHVGPGTATRDAMPGATLGAT